jgi:Uma2 family endonuclease
MFLKRGTHVYPTAASGRPIFTRPDDTDKQTFEIVDGERVAVPYLRVRAAVIASHLAGQLHTQLIDIGQAYVGMLFRLDLPENRCRRPDVAFVSYARWPKNRAVGCGDAWDVAPELAVEIPEGEIEAEELLVKLDEYFRAGVRLVWVIYPRQSLVYVYQSLTQVCGLGREDVLDGGAVLPGFRLALSELFPGV